MASLVARLSSHARIPLYRNAYALMLSGSMSSALGVLYWILASRLYPAEVVGTGSSAIAALGFLGGVASLYLDGSLVRFLPRAGAATLRMVVTCYAMTASFAAVVAATFVLGIDVWSPALSFVGSSTTWVAATIVATVLTVIFQIEDGALIGIRRTLWVPLENIAYGIG